MSIAAPADGESRLLKPLFPHVSVREGPLYVPRIGYSIGWNASATSYTRLADDGTVSFLTPAATVGAIVGIAADEIQDYPQLTHAIYATRGTMRALEGGTLVGSAGTFTDTDVLAIVVTAGAVTYKKNGTTFYTSTVATSGQQAATAFLYVANDAIYDLTVAPSGSSTTATGYALARPGSAIGGHVGYSAGRAISAPGRVFATSGALLSPTFNHGNADAAPGRVDAVSFGPRVTGYARAKPGIAVGADIANYVYGRAIAAPGTASGTAGLRINVAIVEDLYIVDELSVAYRMLLSIISSMSMNGLLVGLTTLPRSVIETLHVSSSLLFVQLIDSIVEALQVDDQTSSDIALLASIIGTLQAADQAASLQTLHAAIMGALAMRAADALVGASAPRETWAVNDDKNNASTRYANFDFNSFAVFKGRAYGVRSDGLYLLEGDDDAGMPITASMHFGKVKFGSSAMKRLGAVYVGAASDGALYLKVTTKAQGTFLYKARSSDPDMKTQRFDVGRGFFDSYYEFELFNAEGADFSLDSIEFVPVPTGRRV